MVDFFEVAAGGGAEVAGGDEDAGAGVVGVEGADEVAELGFADGVAPALGLDVDGVEAEGVGGDYGVDAAIGGGGGREGMRDEVQICGRSPWRGGGG